jgi:hypothetical protein
MSLIIGGREWGSGGDEGDKGVGGDEGDKLLTMD